MIESLSAFPESMQNNMSEAEKIRYMVNDPDPEVRQMARAAETSIYLFDGLEVHLGDTEAALEHSEGKLLEQEQLLECLENAAWDFLDHVSDDEADSGEASQEFRALLNKVAAR